MRIRDLLKKIEKMTVKSKKITNIGKDVESGGLATDPQNPKGCCNGSAFLKFLTCLTWLYCTFLAVFGGFWFAQLPNVVGLDDPNARLFVKISVWGFIPAYLCFFGLGGARSLISSDRKDELWSIKMFMYFYDWIEMVTKVLIFTDLMGAIVAYCSGPVGTVFNFDGFCNVALHRFGVLIRAWTGYCMLAKVHNKAFASEGLTLLESPKSLL